MKKILIVLIVTICTALTAEAATLTVTKTADTNDGVCNSDCSLREAIAVAQSGDTIQFASPLFDTARTITLTSSVDGGLLVSGKTITINGRGANLTAVSGNNIWVVLRVSPGANLTLNNLTIRDGRFNGFDGGLAGGIWNNGTLSIMNSIVSNNTLEGSGGGSFCLDFLGGGIYNEGTLSLTNSIIRNNSINVGFGFCRIGGGGIFNYGTLTITNSNISNNSSTSYNGNGGGIYSGSGTLSITNSTVSGNSAGDASNLGFGGGIYQFNSTVTIANSTINNNFANEAGGGIFTNTGTLSLTNSTVASNSVGGNYIQNFGGGIYTNTGTLLVTNSTVSGNSVTGTDSGGGGIYNYNSTTARVRNTIISGNTAPSNPDLSGTLATNDTNLIGNAASVRLAPLGFYGGSTMTHALLSGSTAINAGNNCVLTATCSGFNAPVNLTTDQRGASRVGNVVDIGAFELNNSANGGNYKAILPSAAENTPYSFTIIPETGSTTYCISAGSLPPGLSGIPLCLSSFAKKDSVFSKDSELVPAAALIISGTPSQYGSYNFSLTATNANGTNVTDYTLHIVGPTAAGASVSGRVMTYDGRGVINAIVTMTDQYGTIRSYRTSAFGYFRFDDVEVGQVYIFQVKSKQFLFAPQIVSVTDDLTALNFTAQE